MRLNSANCEYSVPNCGVQISGGAGAPARCTSHAPRSPPVRGRASAPPQLLHAKNMHVRPKWARKEHPGQGQMHSPRRRSSSSTTSSSSSRAAMRFFRLSYIAAGSMGAGSAFFLDLPFVTGAEAAGCSWRVDPDGGVGAVLVGGGLTVVRGEAAGVVAVVVTVPFMAASGKAVRGRVIGSGVWLRNLVWCNVVGLAAAPTVVGARWRHEFGLVPLLLYTITTYSFFS